MPRRGARGLANRDRPCPRARRPLARLPVAEDVWNEFADLAPHWSGIRYDRIEEVGLQWPCVARDDPGSVYLHAPHPARPHGKGRFFPVEYQPPIEEPDSRVPVRALDRAHALPLQLRDDDDARAGHDRQAGGAVRRDHAEDAWALGVGDGDWVRLVSRRGELEARASVGERVYPGLVWMALHFAQAKVNWLTHDVGDPLIGTPEYKVSAVAVELDRDRRASDRRRRVRVDPAAAGRRRPGRRYSGRRSPDGRSREARSVVGRGSRNCDRRLGAVAAASRAQARRRCPCSAGSLPRRLWRRSSGLRSSQIKWPNDVMVNRRKVAGVLAEARDGAVVLGIGDQRQPDAERATSGRDGSRSRPSAPSTAASTIAAALLAVLLARLDRFYAVWREGGLDAIFHDLGSRDFLRGRRVSVDAPTARADGGADDRARRERQRLRASPTATQAPVSRRRAARSLFER